jgi:predicted DNA-binding transcriptional regulator YafY
VRIFKLTRVRNLTVTDEHFAERDLLQTPPNPGPESHQKRDVTIKLKIAPEMTYRVYDEFSEDCAERRPDGSFIVTVTWPEDEWVYGTILSYGEYAEVLEPEHLREIIKNKTLRTAKMYL